MWFTIFDDNDNEYDVSDGGTYSLEFLGGEDSLFVFPAAAGCYVIADMGDDADEVSVDAAGSELHIDLGDGDDQAVLWDWGFAEMFGGAGDDVISLHGDGAVYIDGGGDDDSFDGWGYIISGVIYGGSGNDEFDGFSNSGAGLTLRGGTGDDDYYLNGPNSPNIVEYANQGLDTIHLQAPASYVMSEDIENLIIDGGGVGDASFTITAPGNTNNAIDLRGLGGFLEADATVFAGPGNDSVYTGDGDDFLYGGAGSDMLSAHYGDDMLKGGAGRDVMSGGAGSDTFFFDSVSDSPTGFLTFADSITDYEGNIDVIDLHNIDANTLFPGNQTFSRVGAPTGAAGQLWVVSLGSGNYKVYADVNGGGADFALDVHMYSGSSASDMFFSY